MSDNKHTFELTAFEYNAFRRMVLDEVIEAVKKTGYKMDSEIWNTDIKNYDTIQAIKAIEKLKDST